MNAVEVAVTGAPDVLNYLQRPQPTPGPGEVLIRTEAIGVNYIDTYFRAGLYPAELPLILGGEAAGTVAELGPGVSSLAVGDRVVSAAASGAYAQYCTAPAALTAPLPATLDFDAAAAVFLKGLTAHYLITSVYPVARDDTVLVHAGAGGVGLILTRWASALGARVITTVSSPAKAELSRQAGAVAVLDYPRHDEAAHFGARIRELTDGNGVPVVYDGVGATTVEASLSSLAVRGTLALFGAASGPVPPIDPQRLNAAGSVYLTRPTLAHFVRTAEEFSWRAAELFDAIANGSIQATVTRHYELADAAQAHRDLHARRTVGSIVLLP